MKKRLITTLFITHLFTGFVGFAVGIYVLPILIAPESPSMAAVNDVSMQADFSAVFTRELAGSDAFHWGEGKVFIGNESVSFMGKIAPGPDYKLYLSPKFVETEQAFNLAKGSMVRVGEVNTFENFIVEMPEGINPENYTTVIVWCERFGEFITAARYQ